MPSSTHCPTIYQYFQFLTIYKINTMNINQEQLLEKQVDMLNKIVTLCDDQYCQSRTYPENKTHFDLIIKLATLANKFIGDIRDNELVQKAKRMSYDKIDSKTLQILQTYVSKQQDSHAADKASSKQQSESQHTLSKANHDNTVADTAFSQYNTTQQQYPMRSFHLNPEQNPEQYSSIQNKTSSNNSKIFDIQYFQELQSRAIN